MKKYYGKSLLLILLVILTSQVFSEEIADTDNELSKKLLSSQKYKKGICVQVDIENGNLIAALAKNSELYVQGCATKMKIVTSARNDLLAKKILEKTSIIFKEEEGLPYADNLINLLVSTSWGQDDSKKVTADELIRVLCPGGSALISNSKDPGKLNAFRNELKGLSVKVEKISLKGWLKVTKNLNSKFGTWAQLKGGADQSYVGNDESISPWKEIKWIADPRWGSLYLSYSGFVSAGGRIYYIENRMDKMGNQNYLIARDGYNGMKLWETKTGPSYISGHRVNATLCCDENNVYILEGQGHTKYLKCGKVVKARDGMTGEIIKDIAFTFNSKAVTVSDDFVVASGRLICGAANKITGKQVWLRKNNLSHPPAKGGLAIIVTAGFVEGVELKTGSSRWHTKSKYIPTKLTTRQIVIASIKNETIFVVVKDKFNKADAGFIIGFDLKTGKELWKQDGLYSHGVLPFDDELWLMNRIKEGKAMNTMNVTILNPQSGKKIKDMRVLGNVYGKCWPARAIRSYVMYSNGWYLNKKSGVGEGNKTTRSPCRLGQHPANGLTYYMPHHCDCGISLRGFLALSKADTKKWLKGLNWKNSRTATGLKEQGAVDKPSDWPMYRKNGVRGNATKTSVGNTIKELWSIKLSNSVLTQSSIAYGNLYVGIQYAQQVLCLDANTGKQKWSFIADGRIEYAPTLSKGICLVGTNAGTLFGLDALNGHLLWKLRAAPVQKFIGDREKLDSPWPIIGGVLVVNDVAFFSAGRSSSQSGGLMMFAVKIQTGTIQWKVRGGTSGDMFLTEGSFLSHTGKGYDFNAGKFNYRLKRPKTPFLHTTRYANVVSITDYMATTEPSLSYKKHIELTDGRIRGDCIAFTKEFVVAGLRYTPGVKNWKKKENKNRFFVHSAGSAKWHKHDVKQQMMALLIAGNNSFGVGYPITWDPKETSELWVLSNATGKTLQRIALKHRPAYDGLSSANGKLYLACEDGQLICFGK